MRHADAAGETARGPGDPGGDGLLRAGRGVGRRVHLGVCRTEVIPSGPWDPSVGRSQPARLIVQQGGRIYSGRDTRDLKASIPWPRSGELENHNIREGEQARAKRRPKIGNRKVSAHSYRR